MSLWQGVQLVEPDLLILWRRNTGSIIFPYNSCVGSDADAMIWLLLEDSALGTRGLCSQCCHLALPLSWDTLGCWVVLLLCWVWLTSVPFSLAVNLRSWTMTSSTSLSTPPSLHFPHTTSLLCVVSVSAPLLLLLLCNDWMQ